MTNRPQNTFFFPFDPASPLLVAKGVLVSGTLGAITGASIGVVQTKNPFALSINMTINLSIASLTFFSIREYLVSPLLLSIDLTPSHKRRYNQLAEASGLSLKQLGKLPAVDSAQSLTEVRLDRLVDSALAGGLTGGALSAGFRGRATFGRAAFTSALIASVLQLSANQLRVFRLKALAKRAPDDPPSTSTLSGGIPTPDDLQYAQITPTPSTDSSILQSFEDPLKTSNPLTNASPPSLPERMMGSLSKVLPVRKLTNNEYLETLEKKRAEVDRRLKEIDDEEKRMYDWAKSQGR
ncbi:hypothetical protein IAU60_003310 [Kwoniella sp. DSM 27419]